MTINADVFSRDPRTTSIPNLGVAKIGEPRTAEEWEVLRWELESFVCQGEYLAGLERILSTFLGALHQAQQPAVWVSGFYGSGKSHLVRVLEYLWRDVPFPDGSTARGLAHVPSDIRSALIELDTAGKRHGGLWSAAGTLGAGAQHNVRLGLLGILFQSADLPAAYPEARFTIWLKQNGYYDQVKGSVEAQGRDWGDELHHLYASPILHRALVELVPEWGPSTQEVRAILRAQFANVTDITDDEMVRTMEDVLELRSNRNGQLPLTLLIFDELQQFIGDEAERALAVQTIAEACSARFGSRILLVATGQAALQARPELSKLRGRFTVNVTLSDGDVHRVLREVVLRKQPARVPELDAVLNRLSGEIDRHLGGSRIAATAADKADLTPDYPILPTRRRFWECVFRWADEAGMASQLRTQLRIVHEASRAVADRPLGWVVPADIVYDQLKADMLQSKLLSREIAQIIDGQDDGTDEGRLLKRLCAIVYIIGRLPTDGPSAAGLRATADTLCDLIVEDLAAGSAALRQRVPQLLQGLVAQGTVMLVDDQYRLQTRESAEWQSYYNQAFNRIYADTARIAGDRDTELRQTVAAALKGVSLMQGASKTPRKITLHFGAEPPAASAADIPVWVRDEWSVTEKTVENLASAAGTASALILVLIPRRQAEELRTALAAHAAAEETLSGRPLAQTAEGLEARNAMQTRQAGQRQRIAAILRDLLDHARVFQGGGAEMVAETLEGAVRSAAEAALTRLFPRFAQADHAGWGKVVERAAQGAADALTAVGYNGQVADHPVCREIVARLGSHGRTGREVRAHLTGVGYGWPQDAVDGALLALLGGGLLRARLKGQAVAAKGLAQSQIGVVEFHNETRIVTATQRIEVRGLLAQLGVPFANGSEADALPALLARLGALAEEAGGPAPLPAPPAPPELAALRALQGNEQLIAVHQQRQRIADWFAAWAAAHERIADRRPRWRLLQDLLRHAAGLPAEPPTRQQAEAIMAQRSLLAEPDPLPPLLSAVGAALRSELQAATRLYDESYQRALDELHAAPAWQSLAESEQSYLLTAHAIAPAPAPTAETEERLLQALDQCALAAWRDRAAALPSRAAQARAEAVRRLEPQAVRVAPPPATLKTPAEAEAYLSALRARILEQIERGHPVII